MAEKPSESSKKSGSGCMGLLGNLLLLLVLTGMATAVFFVSQPQDLTMIGGYGPAAALSPRKDLKANLQSAVDRHYEITLTEEDVNAYLSRTLSAKQGGLLANFVTLDAAWVRFEEERAEVILERRVFGHPFTVSCYVQVRQTVSPTGTPSTDGVLNGGPYLKDLPINRGGKFGQLVVPEGFMTLLLPSLKNLAALYQEELDLAFGKMERIRFEKGKLVLDAKDPADQLNSLNGRTH